MKVCKVGLMKGYKLVTLQINEGLFVVHVNVEITGQLKKTVDSCCNIFKSSKHLDGVGDV